MEFPVDVLATLSHEDLVHSAEDYMSDLLYSNPDNAEHFSLPNSRRIPLTISNVGFVPLYGSDLRHKVLALFSPEDQFTAVALYLGDQWWAVEDILKTADPSRKGLLKVRSLGEKIALYALNRIVYRSKEMSQNEVPFLCHSASDYAKILWKNGEAVGFYSVKPTGSLCNSFLTQRYLLPVMDSIFVRKIHRGNGHGLQILEDFVDCFKEDSLGLKYPLSQAMLKVCGQYLNTYPADRELLWEVESVGGPFQRCRIASKLQSIAVSGLCLEDALLHENDIAMEEEVQKETLSNSVEVTEVTMVNKHLRADTEDMPVSTRTRGSGYRRKRIREEVEVTEESLPDKITRVDDSATAKVANSEGETPAEEGQLAPDDDEGEGEEQPDEEVEDGDKEELSPVNKEVEKPVGQETPAQEEENLTLEVEQLAKVVAEQINGEVTEDFGKEEGEITEEPAAVEENCTQEEEEGQKDVDMEEAIEDIVEDKDTGGAVPEGPEEQTSAVEESLHAEQASSAEEPLPTEEEQTSPVEEALPTEEEQTSPAEEALPAEEEQTSPVEEALPTEEEQTSPAEETLPKEEEQTSPVEEALPAEQEQTSLGEEALPAEQGEISPIEEVDVDEQASTADEALSSEEHAAPTKEETPLVEQEEEAQPAKEEDLPEEAMAVEEQSPAAGEALAAEMDSSVNEDTSVDPVEDTVDHQKAPELEKPAPEVADGAIVVLDKVIPDNEEEGMEEKRSTEAAPLERVNSPSEPSPPLDKDTMNLSQDAVLLVGLKEVTYCLNGDNENDRTAQEVEKMEEEVPKGDVAEKGKDTEEEKTEEEKARTTEEEEEVEVDDGETLELSSDDDSEPPVVDMTGLRRKNKEIQAPPKRKSTRLNKRPLEDDQTAVSELEDESMEKEEENATSTEEEAVEKSSDEADEPPVVDRRVLRRKTKVIQSPSKPRGKRRSKT
ncbi:soluble lamin-associated protein of 75 kDa-like isoform X1 [Anguilla rostrata]|uniref:soluble lamin-associated protein of 75 kDa-like isoform X1 n=1 Tax=Anguilla rostrata TaxID=7938 RepID=UPI0030D4629D